MTDKARCCVLSGFCLQAQPGWCCPSHGQDWEPRKALLWWPGRVGCSASQAAVCTEPWEPGCWDWQQHRWQKAPLLFLSRCKRCRVPYCQRGSLAWGPPRGYDAGNTSANTCIRCWAVWWASVLTGHGRQKSVETAHDTDGQQQEHPATARKVLDGWLPLVSETFWCGLPWKTTGTCLRKATGSNHWPKLDIFQNTYLEPQSC